ncbi:hypothetical protein QYE76_011983 [Lolium multiflorum]|uniref:Uncharacterized protein n=1 Tax=Lolium multiflorum TaxID=4521 RepID=A0AAD8TWD9_LOLMU|nr:hypothetical protein QYE76_011983 [Lolium multiflorum]
MQGNRPAGVLLILAAILLLAFDAPAAAAASYSGRVVTSHAAAGARASAHLDAPAFTRRLEDEVAPEMMTWAASLAGGGGGISPPLNANKQACGGSCAGKGPNQPYTRDCKMVYTCRP